ncbi:FAD-linked oxidase-like protein [Amanita muscaria]
MSYYTRFIRPGGQCIRLGGYRFHDPITRTRGPSNIPFSTQNTVHKTSNSKRWTNAICVLLASGVAGYIGYYLGHSGESAGITGHHVHRKSPSPKFGTRQDFENGIRELTELFPGDSSSTSNEELETHGFSGTDYHPGALHSIIVYPQSTEDVVKIVKVATKYRIPVIPYSAATSLEGQTRGHPTVGGICVDISHMDKILEIHADDGDLVCQAGAGWMDINETLKEKGIPLFFPIDPAPTATIGGMLSTGCSGTNAVRYGTARGEWILNATVVLPSGEVIKTRQRARKSSTGFDTTKLFIGAEGTLGIITEVTIKLTPVLPTTVAVVHFPDVHKATEAVIEVLNKGVGIQCVELMDDQMMSATNKYGQASRKWPEKDTIYFKFQGPTKASLAETAKIAKSVVEKYGGTGFTLAKDDKEAAELWTDRKNALYAGLAMYPGAKAWSTDVCVPLTKLPDLVYQTKRDLEEIGIPYNVLGHVGDGNFHTGLFFKTEEEKEIVRQATHRMVKRAIALDGTCTGEHGVGIGKKKYLVEELGEGTVQLMKSLKRTIDPLGLFNPGKLYPDESDNEVEGKV